MIRIVSFFSWKCTMNALNKLFSGLTEVTAGTASVLASALPHTHSSSIQELRENYAKIIQKSPLPDTTKENLLVSLNSPQTLYGVCESLSSDWSMLQRDMNEAVKQYVN